MKNEKKLTQEQLNQVDGGTYPPLGHSKERLNSDACRLDMREINENPAEDTALYGTSAVFPAVVGEDPEIRHS